MKTEQLSVVSVADCHSVLFQVRDLMFSAHNTLKNLEMIILTLSPELSSHQSVATEESCPSTSSSHTTVTRREGRSNERSSDSESCPGTRTDTT